MSQPPRAFNVSTTFVHLGLGGVAIALPGFEWTQAYLEGYERETELDGEEGRLVSLLPHAANWSHWERHPAGEELVVVLSGRVVVIQDRDGEENRVELASRQALVNPRSVWHTMDVLDAGEALYITPGVGTQHRPRGDAPA
ncbi:MAG: cupin domain-containing protein [Acidimicrobiales bacterium]|jgi:mannose-6-phosphate isomerase-like protein (cupin superfamily)